VARLLLETCRAAGLTVGVDGDRLVVEGAGAPPANLLDELRQHKSELMVALAPAPTVLMLHPVTDNDAFAERAAIVEYDAITGRDWAEALARIDGSRPPADVPPQRWQQLIDDAGRFIDQRWAARAETLGWSPLDMFGADRIKPFARLDRAGLLWLINGRKLIALTENTATIETTPGSPPQTYRRRDRGDGRVLLWDLGGPSNVLDSDGRRSG
jgi:hypothetical protein